MARVPIPREIPTGEAKMKVMCDYFERVRTECVEGLAAGRDSSKCFYDLASGYFTYMFLRGHMESGGNPGIAHACKIVPLAAAQTVLRMKNRYELLHYVHKAIQNTILEDNDLGSMLCYVDAICEIIHDVCFFIRDEDGPSLSDWYPPNIDTTPHVACATHGIGCFSPRATRYCLKHNFGLPTYDLYNRASRSFCAFI